MNFQFPFSCRWSKFSYPLKDRTMKKLLHINCKIKTKHNFKPVRRKPFYRFSFAPMNITTSVVKKKLIQGSSV